MRLRRTVGTVVDYLLAAAWAGVLLLVVVLTGVTRDLGVVSGQLLGVAALTVPVTLGLAAAERRGGSPGKRLAGLRLVGARGPTVTTGAALTRTALKVALPWELAHAAVWRLGTGDTGPVASALLVAAYVPALVGGVAVLAARTPWYDRVAGTRCLLTGSGRDDRSR